MTKDIRLIAMDMDGTLLDQDQQIPRENREALREATEKGIDIAICSGRMADDASFFASDEGLSRCHILGLNGACCLDTPHGKPYAVHTMARETVEGCLSALREQNVTFACFQAQRVLVRSGNVELPLMHWGSHQRRPHSAEYCFGDEAMNRYKDEGVCKIVYIDLPRHPRIEELRARLSTLAGLDVTSSWENNLELMPAGVGKGPAVSELAQRLGLKREQVMCLGDYDNDLSMIEYAGVGVAMENGSDRVKRAAVWIAPSNQECGVAQAIRRFAL